MFDNIAITSKILALIASVDEWKGEWKHAQKINEDKLSTLLLLSNIESIGASTRLENSTLNDEAVQQIVEAGPNFKSESHAHERVANYAYALEAILANANKIGITPNNIKQLHNALYFYSTVNFKGQFKSTESVFETDELKSIATAFAKDVPERLEQLCKKYNHAIEYKTHHPLILIGVFIIEFLAIHPFSEGNLALSRLLSTLLLIQNGYEYTKYGSLEAIVEQNKRNYLISIESSLTSTPINFTIWLEFFTGIMQKQVLKIQRKINYTIADKKHVQLEVDAESKSTTLKSNETTTNTIDAAIDISIMPKLSQNIIKLITQEGIATNQDIVKFTKQNRNTIKKHLQNLVRLQLIKQHGVGKGSRYTI